MRGVHEPPASTNSSASISRPSRVVTARTRRSPLDLASRDLRVPREFDAARGERSCISSTKRSGVMWRSPGKYTAPSTSIRMPGSSAATAFASSTSAAMPSARPISAVSLSSSSAWRVRHSISRPFLTRPKSLPGKRGELLEAAVARFAQVAQQRRAAAHVLGRGRAPEPVAPREELRRQPRLHVERRRGIPHPLERERDHARRRERHEMARDEHPRVAERAAVAALRIALDERDRQAAAHAVIRGAQADDAAADDDDPLAHRFAMPTQTDPSRCRARTGRARRR